MSKNFLHDSFMSRHDIAEVSGVEAYPPGVAPPGSVSEHVRFAGPCDASMDLDLFIDGFLFFAVPWVICRKGDIATESSSTVSHDEAWITSVFES